MPRSDDHQVEEEDDGREATHTIATNLAVPTTQSPSNHRRRRRGTRLLRRPQKRQRPSPDPDVHDPLSQLTTLPDSIIALHTLHDAWPHAARDNLPSTPPLMLESQLKALVSDLAALHRDLSGAVARGEVLRLQLPTGDGAYILRADAVPSDAPDGLRDVLREADGRPAVSAACLADAGVSELLVTNLVRSGYLTMRDETSFWLAVPGMALFVEHRAAGQKEIVSLLKRAPYSEMLLGRLELRTMKKSFFTAQWHVRDVVGSGVAETVATSVGPLVRLIDSGP